MTIDYRMVALSFAACWSALSHSTAELEMKM
jgi:hypothetical protein